MQVLIARIFCLLSDPESEKLQKGVVKKQQSLIVCYIDAKTTDRYIIRVGVIGFTDRYRAEWMTFEVKQAIFHSKSVNINSDLGFSDLEIRLLYSK